MKKFYVWKRILSFFGAFFNIKDIDLLPGLKGESQQKVLLSNDNTIFYFASSLAPNIQVSFESENVENGKVWWGFIGKFITPKNSE